MGKSQSAESITAVIQEIKGWNRKSIIHKPLSMNLSPGWKLCVLSSFLKRKNTLSSCYEKLNQGKATLSPAFLLPQPLTLPINLQFPGCLASKWGTLWWNSRQKSWREHERMEQQRHFIHIKISLFQKTSQLQLQFYLSYKLWISLEKFREQTYHDSKEFSNIPPQQDCITCLAEQRKKKTHE